jgi:cytochrome c biogenesis protein CcdA
MARFITPCMFVLIAIGFFSISKSKRHYRELVENNDEIYTRRNIKVLRIGGYFLLGCAFLLSVMIFFSK